MKDFVSLKDNSLYKQTLGLFWRLNNLFTDLRIKFCLLNTHTHTHKILTELMVSYIHTFINYSWKTFAKFVYKICYQKVAFFFPYIVYFGNTFYSGQKSSLFSPMALFLCQSFLGQSLQ